MCVYACVCVCVHGYLQMKLFSSPTYRSPWGSVVRIQHTVTQCTLGHMIDIPALLITTLHIDKLSMTTAMHEQ